jgi:transcriptional regulatory protein RtcR
VRFNAEARDTYVRFATSVDAAWNGNFRELSASITRMATLADGGRVGVDAVRVELERLKRSWKRATVQPLLGDVLTPEQIDKLDLFDRSQLESVMRVCRESRTLAEAGRKLYGVSRAQRSVINDSDRLKKYLARFGLSWSAIVPADA